MPMHIIIWEQYKHPNGLKQWVKTMVNEVLKPSLAFKCLIMKRTYKSHLKKLLGSMPGNRFNKLQSQCQVKEVNARSNSIRKKPRKEDFLKIQKRITKLALKLMTIMI